MSINKVNRYTNKNDKNAKQVLTVMKRENIKFK